MMRALLFLWIFLALLACDEQSVKEPPGEPIRDNLPLSDRDLLLEPLESAMDDLRASIESSEAHFHSGESYEREGLKATMEFKLDGKDTVLLRANLQRDDEFERHEWFYDGEKRLFFSAHELYIRGLGFTGDALHEAYKLYYEEDGSPLSAYGKFSSSGELPEQWTPVCLTREREERLRTRAHAIRQLFSRGG